MKRAPSTDAAKAYRVAARGLEQNAYKGCCEAICVTISPGHCVCLGDTHPLLRKFAEYFRPEVCGYAGYWWDEYSQEARDERVVALCLIAAMVEAGDA